MPTFASGMVSFGAPWLLAGLVIPAAVLAALLHGVRRRRAVAEVLGGPPGLRQERPGRLRLAVGGLVVAASVLAVLAAARPQWGEGAAEVSQRGIDVVIALDVSRSMEAEDIVPSRARAAAAGLAEMLTHMTGNRVGLVVFAGSAFPRAPLTTDLGVVSSLISRAQGESPLVRPGTDFREALASAFRLLNVEDRAETQAIVLVSDGEVLERNYEAAASFASREGVRVYTVFAGTSNPTPLPAESGGTDVSVAQPGVLEEIAATTGGSFRQVETIPGLAVEFRRLQQTQFEGGVETQPIERFAWFAGAAASLLLAVALVGEGGSSGLPRLRGGAIAAGMVGTLLLVSCGTTAWRHVADGNEAYEAERYTEALQAYREAASTQPEDGAINYNIANTLHQLGSLSEAAGTAAQAREFALEVEDGATAALALYTLGNTAFRAGDLEVARDAYQGALRIDPDDEDVKANLELTLRLLTPPPPPEETPPTGGGEGDGNGDGEEPSEGELPEDAQPGEPGQGQPSGGDSADVGGDGSSTPGDEPSEPLTPPGTGAQAGAELPTLEAVQTALQQALGELGPEVSMEEALRILELARQANELDRLPRSSGGSAPPR